MLQTIISNNERRKYEVLEMAFWLDMEPSSAGYGEEEMNFTPGVCRMWRFNYYQKEKYDRNESKQQMVLYVSEMAWRAVV